MTDSHPVIQCSTGPFWTFELENAMAILADAGFTEIELMVTRDPRTQVPDIPLKIADKRGLRIKSVHGPFLVISKNVWGLDPLGKIRRGIEMCREVGADSFIVHPPYLWERRYAAWVTNESAEASAASGVTVGVETMYPKWVAGRQMRAYRWLDPADLLAAAPHVVLDTSHVTVSRKDIIESYRTLAPKLVHIHLSDNARDGRDGHLELEQGKLPLDRFLGELRKTSYAGAISLELSVRRYTERHQDLVRMLSRNREYVERKLLGSTKVDKGLPRRGQAGATN
ncbi:MAG: sugar phosphate isomerase/epimerase [Actinomycetota bacterium]|nr:sugar phosphate isomerase/epimerase [Actinomycetota bacterium]